MSLKNYEKAQKLLDQVPDLLEKKKIGGKDLPTEVWIKKKRESPWLSQFASAEVLGSELLQREAKTLDRFGGELCSMHQNQPSRRLVFASVRHVRY